MRALCWAIILVSVAFALVAAVLTWLSRHELRPENLSLGSTATTMAAPLVALVIVAVGQLIASRHPRHLVAWTFLLFGLTGEATVLLQAYGLYGTLVAPDSLPAADTVLWVATWSWPITEVPLVLALLLFPDGRPIGRRWWWVAGAALVGCAFQMVGDALRVADVLTDVGLERPLPPLPVDALDAISLVGSITWAASMFAAAASLLIRFRRARGDERQQLKWFACAGLLATALFIVAGWLYGMPQLGAVFAGLAAIGVLLVPVSVAVAILRYRLYDIDVLINRTLVYGLTTAAIAIAFFAGIVVLQAVLRPLTGGSEVAVAVSTLASIGMFQPLRTRIQRAVDRRFYRSRYDAARTLDDFSVRLRDQVALDAVRADLLNAVEGTVQPAHASVWLRDRAR
jgi:drug/metabolite transporter (DMT)-like permease